MILFDEDTSIKSYFCRSWALGVTVKILRQDCITVGGSDSSWQLTGVTKRPKRPSLRRSGLSSGQRRVLGLRVGGMLGSDACRERSERDVRAIEKAMTMQRRVDHQKHSSKVPNRAGGNVTLVAQRAFLLNTCFCFR